MLLLQDANPVQDKGPPKSITVEDSFKSCSSLPAAEHVINVLAPDLLARMVEDQQVLPHTLLHVAMWEVQNRGERYSGLPLWKVICVASDKRNHLLYHICSCCKSKAAQSAIQVY